MKKMKTAVIVAVMMVMLFVTTVSTVSADAPTPCGAYNGTVTINGNLISESDPASALHILVEVDGEIVGNDSVSMYIRGGKDCGVAVTGIHEGEDVTFYLKDFCGNKTVAETDPSPVNYFACDGKGHTVNLTFTDVPCPEPTPEPTTTPEVTATPTGVPSNGDGRPGGGGGGPRRVNGGPTPTPTPTPTATPEVTPTPGLEVTPTPTPEVTPTPTVPVDEKGIPAWIWVLIAAGGVVGAGAAYWLHGKKSKGKK